MTFPHMDKEETFFYWKLHIDMVWFLLDAYFSLELENKAKKSSQKLFWEERYRLLLCPNDIPTFWILINLCNMQTGLVT